MSDKGGKLLVSVFYGFMGTVVSLGILWALLQWTLGIDIQKFDGFGFLGLIVWGCWIVGGYLYLSHQEELHIRDEMERIRDSVTSISVNAYTRVAEARLNVENEQKQRKDTEKRVDHALTDNAWQEVKDFRKKQKELLEKDQKESGTNGLLLDSFKWRKKRETEDERTFQEFIKKF